MTSFFSQICLAFLAILALLISMLEQCLIQTCMPQFRGTYDDKQDELLTVDWSAQEEIYERASQVDSRLRFARSTEDYSLRLSELKCRYEDVLRREKKAHRKRKPEGHSDYSEAAAREAGYGLAGGRGSTRSSFYIKSNVPKKCAICFTKFNLDSEVIGLNCSL